MLRQLHICAWRPYILRKVYTLYVHVKQNNTLALAEEIAFNNKVVFINNYYTLYVYDYID